MDQQSHFHIAYRLAAHHHRITEVERGLAQFKRTALRITFFLVLWATAILVNMTSSQVSSLLSTVVKSGSLLL